MLRIHKVSFLVSSKHTRHPLQLQSSYGHAQCMLRNHGLHFLKTLLNYRNESPAILEGKTVHFAPFDGIYMLFRLHPEENLILLVNKNTQAVDIQLNRFEELNFKGKEFQNVLGEETFLWQDWLQIKKQGAYLFRSTKK